MQSLSFLHLFSVRREGMQNLINTMRWEFKKENKKVRKKERNHAFDQESDQEKDQEKSFLD